MCLKLEEISENYVQFPVVYGFICSELGGGMQYRTSTGVSFDDRWAPIIQNHVKCS